MVTDGTILFQEMKKLSEKNLSSSLRFSQREQITEIGKAKSLLKKFDGSLELTLDYLFFMYQTKKYLFRGSFNDLLRNKYVIPFRSTKEEENKKEKEEKEKAKVYIERRTRIRGR